jgi:hypothetical protein
MRQRRVALVAGAALAALLLAACGALGGRGPSAGVERTEQSLRDHGMQNPRVDVFGEQVDVAFDTPARIGTGLGAAKDLAAQLVWQTFPSKVSLVSVRAHSTSDDYDSDEVFKRDALIEQYGARPAGLEGAPPSQPASRRALAAAFGAGGSGGVSLDSYSYVDHYVWSPTPIAPAGTLAANTTQSVSVRAVDASGQELPGAPVFLTFSAEPAGGVASTSGGSCGVATFGPTPILCHTGPVGNPLTILYKTPLFPEAAGGETDTLTAALDAGGADAASDSAWKIAASVSRGYRVASVSIARSYATTRVR